MWLIAQPYLKCTWTYFFLIKLWLNYDSTEGIQTVDSEMNTTIWFPEWSQNCLFEIMLFTSEREHLNEYLFLSLDGILLCFERGWSRSEAGIRSLECCCCWYSEELVEAGRACWMQIGSLWGAWMCDWRLKSLQYAWSLCPWLFRWAQDWLILYFLPPSVLFLSLLTFYDFLHEGLRWQKTTKL